MCSQWEQGHNRLFAICNRKATFSPLFGFFFSSLFSSPLLPDSVSHISDKHKMREEDRGRDPLCLKSLRLFFKKGFVLSRHPPIRIFDVLPVKLASGWEQPVMREVFIKKKVTIGDERIPLPDDGSFV
eukprot:TRINITY_DN4386_c0_g1_i1.p2 TRINITY_DN4386_c0_g1~~TRINITY_DN4386_c0_g1_i1.p2  ORF type:complete len:128 (+),score=1.97 TRINITY_DN4386_c0_g1_i1:316-699(+)